MGGKMYLWRTITFVNLKVGPGRASVSVDPSGT